MKKIIILSIMYVLLFLPNTANAFLEEYIDSFGVEVEFLNRYFPESDEKNEANEIGVVESNLDVNFDINSENDVSWEWDFIFKHVLLSDNASSIDLPAVLVGRSMRIAGQFPIPFIDDDKYRLGASVIPTYFTDSWEDSFKDFEYGAFRWLSEAWVEYEGYDNFTWKLGVLVRPEYEQELLPIVGMNYHFNDQWSFRLTSDDVGINYQYNDQLEFFTEHRYVLDEYEISSGGRDGRVLRHKQNTTGVGLKYLINKDSFVKFSVGGAYNRSFRFVDGDDEPKAVLDETVYTTIELVWNF